MRATAVRFLLCLAGPGIPYAICAAQAFEPLVDAGRISLPLALFLVASPAALGAFGALLSHTRR